jgi:CheY-like chemotaxis protein
MTSSSLVGNEEGLSLAAWMRQQPRFSGIPVIAVTAHALLAEQERFLQSGGNACISKPIDFKLLHRELGKWLVPLQKSPSRV